MSSYSEKEKVERQQLDHDLQNVVQIFPKWRDEVKLEDRRDFDTLEGKILVLIENGDDTATSLRQAANKLDEVWRASKTANAFGTGAGLIGGLLSIGGGVATIMTWGTASILLIAGMTFGAAGDTTNIASTALESYFKSYEVQKANKLLKKTIESVNEVNSFVEYLLSKKESVRILHMYYLAKTFNLGSPMARKILREMVFFSLRKPTHMVWDAIDLSFTIKDLIENKGSDAAKLLREKADEIEGFVR